MGAREARAVHPLFDWAPLAHALPAGSGNCGTVELSNCRTVELWKARGIWPPTSNPGRCQARMHAAGGHPAPAFGSWWQLVAAGCSWLQLVPEPIGKACFSGENLFVRAADPRRQTRLTFAGAVQAFGLSREDAVKVERAPFCYFSLCKFCQLL
jgi:hypothetical protein